MLIHICSVVVDAGETSSFVGRTKEEANAKARGFLEERVMENCDEDEAEAEKLYSLARLRSATTLAALQHWCEGCAAYYSVTEDSDTL